MLTKQIVAKLPARMIRKYGYLRIHLTREELSIKSALETALERVNASAEAFGARLEVAEDKVRNYSGDLKKEFIEYLKSVKDARREQAGYGPSSCY